MQYHREKIDENTPCSTKGKSMKRHLMFFGFLALFTLFPTVSFAEIRGNQDGTDCSYMWGWTCDTNSPNSSLGVTVKIDGSTVATVTANQNRPDVSSVCNGTTAHGYNYYIPQSYKNGIGHTIESSASGKFLGSKGFTCGSGATYSCTGSVPLNALGYGSSDQNGLTSDVSWQYSSYDSSKKCEFYCVSGYSWNGSGCVGSAPSTRGNFDGITCNTMWGWACDPGNSTPLTVNLRANNASFNVNVTANQSRSDAASLCGGRANVGFGIAVPSSLKDNVGHQITATANGTTIGSIGMTCAPACSPNCSNAPNVCNGTSFGDGCGGTCWGSKNCCSANCSNAPNVCSGTSFSDGCGGTCWGSKNCSAAACGTAHTQTMGTSGGPTTEGYSLCSSGNSNGGHPGTEPGGDNPFALYTSGAWSGWDWDCIAGNSRYCYACRPGYVSNGSTCIPACTPSCANAPNVCSGVWFSDGCGGSCYGSKNCAPAPTLNFWADSTNLAYNTGTTLRWNSTNATSCTATGNWSGGKAVNGAEGTGNLTSSRTYYLTCSGAGGSISRSVVVNVALPPLGTPSGLQAQCNAAGNQVTLSWNGVSGATAYPLRVDDQTTGWDGSCTSPDQCADIYATSYTRAVIPERTYGWWVHAYRAADGSYSAAAIGADFRCNAPVYTCNPTSIANATLCSGDNTGLSANTSSTVVDTCTALKCEFTCNSGFVKSGNTCVASAGPSCSINSVALGGGQYRLDYSITWDSTNRYTYMLLTPGNQNVNKTSQTQTGSITVAPSASTTYVLQTGTVASPAPPGWSCQTTVNPPVYVCNPTSIANATLCSGDNTGLSANTNSAVVATCGAPKCEFTCNSGFARSGNTCFAVIPLAPVPDLKINGSNGPITVNTGDNLNITWENVANATSCSGSGAKWGGIKAIKGGNDNVAATSTSNYIITCTGPGGTGSDQVVVNVNPPVPSYNLSVSFSSGSPLSATVKSSPSGIDCGSDCNENYTQGTSVTLAATQSNSLYKFDGWSGDCSGTNATCTVTMNAAKNVMANFTAIPQCVCKSSEDAAVCKGKAYTNTCGNTCNGTKNCGAGPYKEVTP